MYTQKVILHSCPYARGHYHSRITFDFGMYQGNTNQQEKARISRGKKPQNPRHLSFKIQIKKQVLKELIRFSETCCPERSHQRFLLSSQYVLSGSKILGYEQVKDVRIIQFSLPPWLLAFPVCSSPRWKKNHNFFIYPVGIPSQCYSSFITRTLIYPFLWFMFCLSVLIPLYSVFLP